LRKLSDDLSCDKVSRRKFIERATAAGLSLGVLAKATENQVDAQTREQTPAANPGRVVRFDAKPNPVAIATAETAVIVVDMQNDFGAKGGMLDLAGIDLSGIRKAIGPTAKVLASARRAGVKIIYLKMGFRPDLSDLGAPDSPNRVRHLQYGVGRSVHAPDGRESRILIRDTWDTDILDELKPQADDIVIYKHRFSGFYQTDLDATLKRAGIKHLIITGCTTSVCVESTVRDAMFRDYSCVLLQDCMSQPTIGNALPGSNHDASLVVVEANFGWVSSSDQFMKALDVQPIAADALGKWPQEAELAG
jgi:ureidoacrylate peracid hydrolase